MVSKALIASITASFTVAGAVFLGGLTENIFLEVNERFQDAINGRPVSTERVITDEDLRQLENITDSMELTVKP